MEENTLTTREQVEQDAKNGFRQGLNCGFPPTNGLPDAFPEKGTSAAAWFPINQTICLTAYGMVPFWKARNACGFRRGKPYIHQNRRNPV